MMAAAMRIPTVTIDTIVMHRDEANPRFDKSTGHQAGLAVQMSSVSIAQRVWFSADVECCPGSVGCDEIERAPLILIVTGHRRGFVHSPNFTVELFQQRASPIQSVERQFLGIHEPLNLELQFLVGAVSPVGIVRQIPFLNVRGQRIVTAAEPTGVFPGPTVSRCATLGQEGSSTLTSAWDRSNSVHPGSFGCVQKHSVALETLDVQKSCRATRVSPG